MRIPYLALLPILFLSLGLSAQNRLDLAEKHIRKNPAVYGITPQDLDDWRVTDNYVSLHNGVNHIYFQQTINGIPLEGALIDVHIAANGDILAGHSRFARNAADKAQGTQGISAATALQSALAELGIPAPAQLQEKERPGGPTAKVVFEAFDGVAKDIPVELAYALSGKEIRLMWKAMVETETPEWHVWEVYMDASSGEYSQKRDHVLHCDFGHPGGACSHSHHSKEMKKEAAWEAIPKKQNQFFAPDSYLVYDIPVESPNHGGRTTVTNPADATASPFGWHDTDGSAGAEFTITRGNNVHSQEDQNGNNGTGFSPDGGASLDFIYTIDLTLDPTLDAPAENRSSAITNLFYWNNIIHDIFYHYGFDEPSGNFQQNNYGNGGNGGDYVLADAQDGSGTNNANFATPADGGNGRMQMFLWTGGGAITTFDVNSPAGIAGSYNAVPADFGSNNYNITGDLVIADDGSGNPTQACGALVNAGAINGNIALIDRGTCEFGAKCLNAENAGAVAVVVCNNVAGNPIIMGPGADGGSVTIPCIMISQGDCATIRAQIPTVNVTMTGTPQAAQLDGDFDNGIIAHEYGHGISTRLTGGPGTSCLGNSEQAGEGWSDFFGLFLTHEPSDTRNTARGIGTYAAGQGTGGGGIRTWPYSADMAVNPFTYDDVKTEAVPHGVGSVFCTMLWDLYWDLVDEYGYDTDLYGGTGGNNIAMQLVMDGLKFQPCSPGFVDARDAILLADEINYAGANKCLIWNAFARRGLGFSADQGSSGSVSDGTEAFDLPPDLLGVEIAKTADRASANEGETITYTLDIASRCSDVTNVVVRDNLPAGLIYVPGSASNGGIESGGVITWPTIANMVKGDSDTYTYQATVNAGTYAPLANIFTDDMESGGGNWTTSNAQGETDWVLVTDGGSTRWWAEEKDPPNNAPDTENQYLTLGPLALDGFSEMSFLHRYDTETNWDGGTMEISMDNGATWRDLGPYMTSNGYNDYIQNNPGKPAFSGDSGGYITTSLDLGAFCGATVLIRFNFYYDAAVAGNGWYVDDVNITSEAAVPNLASTTTGGITIEAYECVQVLQTLPVEWGGLDAEIEGLAIRLDWTTLTEMNNAGFEVQRRTESEPAFRNIAWVEGAGDSQTPLDYTHLDRDVLPGIRYYYRIKQVDKDGGSFLSEVEEEMLPLDGNPSLLLYPNPVKGNVLHIQINGLQGTPEGVIQIIDGSGRLARTQAVTAVRNTVGMEGLPSGIYTVKVLGDGFHFVEKVRVP